MYDVLVVGARCSGSPTAMLLAQRGYRVLVVDRARFPSDVVSTHYLHLPAVARLRRWGLLDRLMATGCPPIHRINYGMAGIYLSGMSPEWEGETWGVAPRRTVLDQLLVEAAVAAGAEVREGYTVDEVLFDGDRVVGIRGHDRHGRAATDHATIVVGADGVHSPVARAVGAEEYAATPAGTAVWYSYWADTGLRELTFTRQQGCELFVVPTNDDLVNVLVGVKEEQFHEFRADIEGNYHRGMERFPEYAPQIRAGRRVEQFYGTRYTRQFLRKPYGDGWALIGDAAYHKDPIAGIGITDAFRQVDVLVDAIDAGLSGRRSMSLAMASYHAWRDQTFIPVLEYISRIHTLDEFPPEILAVIRALRHNREQTTRFLGLFGGYTPFNEFFSPQNCAAILAAATDRAAPPDGAAPNGAAQSTVAASGSPA